VQCFRDESFIFRKSFHYREGAVSAAAKKVKKSPHSKLLKSSKTKAKLKLGKQVLTRPRNAICSHGWINKSQWIYIYHVELNTLLRCKFLLDYYSKTRKFKRYKCENIRWFYFIHLFIHSFSYLLKYLSNINTFH